MKNFYEILGVRRNATQAEIRSAFRKKAKILHPDITGEDSLEFRNLKEAYETLSDIRSRHIFDEAPHRKSYSSVAESDAPWNKERREETFDYEKWLREQGDNKSMSFLILYFILREEYDKAVEEYKSMNMNHSTFRLDQYLIREDFMDYGFILAEELVLRKEYYDAVLLLEEIIEMERSMNYFKLFFPEVMNLARSILHNNIEGFMNDELAIDAWEKALDMGFSKKDNAFFLQKMADAYERIGDPQTALVCREESFRLAS